MASNVVLTKEATLPEKISKYNRHYNIFSQDPDIIHIKYCHLSRPIEKSRAKSLSTDWKKLLDKIKQARMEGKVNGEHLLIYKIEDGKQKQYCLMINLRI